jgi:glutathione synthase/RimK-type ligase-like ATP-grasp enzyme
LTSLAMQPGARSWDAPGEPWEAYDAVVLRSSWDYHLRTQEFLAWLDDLERRAACVFNPVPTLRWNATKTYLADLSAAGIPVVPTVWIDAGAGTKLGEVIEDRGWPEAVVKPTISATAYETWRVAGGPTWDDVARFARLLGLRSMMVQRYLPSIEVDGELSLVFLGGRYSHAVRKRPLPGDFRVQHEFGGTIEAATASGRLVEVAARALAETPDSCLYARVDGCVEDDRFLLMELEVVEPSLFFHYDAGSARRLADAIHRAVASR